MNEIHASIEIGSTSRPYLVVPALFLESKMNRSTHAQPDVSVDVSPTATTWWQAWKKLHFSWDWGSPAGPSRTSETFAQNDVASLTEALRVSEEKKKKKAKETGEEFLESWDRYYVRLIWPVK